MNVCHIAEMESEILSKRSHFRSHMVFSVDNEPLAGCVAGEKFLLSTLGHNIEVRNLDEYGSLSHSFSTVDLVKQMIYSSVGKYIATLEVKTTRLSLTTHVRLYFNWQMESNGVAMRARIAGRVTPSSQSAAGQLEMVELPLKHQASHVNCCISTANLVVGCARCVSLYRFCVKVHPLSKIQFQDVEHVLDVYVTFPVKEVALCEEYLAFMSSCEVQVIKFISNLDAKVNQNVNSDIKAKQNITLRSPQLNSNLYPSDDDNLIVLSTIASPTTVFLPSLLDPPQCDVDRCKGPRVVMGPIDYFAGLPVKIESTGSSIQSFRSISLLYQRFPAILPTNATPYFCLHSLNFHPFYMADDECDVDSSSHLFHSPRRSQLRRLEVFYSGQTEGHLYDVTDRVHLVSTYNYAGRVYHVSVDNSVLHAVGNSGVYTYSLAHWNRIIEHVAPDKPEKQPCLHNFNLNSVLLGFQHFVGVQLAAFGDGFLVLLVNSSGLELADDGCCWTAYALQCPLAEVVYSSFLEEDLMLESDDDERKWFLLHDVHCALTAEVLRYKPPNTSRLHRYFQQASLQLGDFYLKIDSWSSVAFYRMAGGSLDDRIRHILKLANDVKNKRSVCLVLSLIFIKDFFENCETLSQENADLVLRVIAENEPSLLSSLILKKILRGYDNALAAELLQLRLRDRKCVSIEDSLAACVCCIAAGQMDRLPSLLLPVSDDSLLNMSARYPDVWLNGEHTATCQLQFTPLTQLIQQMKPTLFIQILLRIIASGTVCAVNIATQLCQSDCWEEFGMAHKSDSFLVQFLEEYVRSKLDCCAATFSLASLYLKNIADNDAVRLPSQVKPWRLFASRPNWINRLPPFTGRSMSRDSCLLKSNVKVDVDHGCPCSLCNDCLLRLQSLLCSKAATVEVKQRLSSLLETSAGKVRGEESLRLLCCRSPLEAVRRLIAACPNAIVEYCIENIDMSDNHLWSETVQLLTADGDSIVEGIVCQLSETLSPNELAKLVPDGKFTMQLLRSIKKCQAKQLHQLIVTEGNAMTNRI